MFKIRMKSTEIHKLCSDVYCHKLLLSFLYLLQCIYSYLLKNHFRAKKRIFLRGSKSMREGIFFQIQFKRSDYFSMGLTYFKLHLTYFNGRSSYKQLAK